MGRTAGMSIKYLIISIFNLNIYHQIFRKKLTNLWNMTTLTPVDVLTIRYRIAPDLGA